MDFPMTLKQVYNLKFKSNACINVYRLNVKIIFIH